MSELHSRIRIWRNADVGKFAVTEVDTVNEYFYIAGDHTAEFTAGQKFRVKGPTGNDGEWEVSASTYIGGQTRITVTGNITDSTIDGYVHLHAIVGATIATSTFRITGDYTDEFPAGRSFSVSDSTGNDKGYEVSSSSHSGGYTDIVVTGTIADGTANGTIDRYDCLTYAIGADALPTYSLPGRRIVDRLGLVHRVTPVTNIARYVNSLTIPLPDFDLDLVSTEGSMLAEFLETHCIDADNELEVFTQHSSVNQNSVDYSFKRCYKVHIEALPPWLYGNHAMTDGAKHDITLEAHVSQNGTFTDWDDITSTTYGSRPT